MTDEYLGSWLSSLKNKVVGYVAGKGNTPGTPETRKYGYDREAVAKAVVEQLKAPAPISSPSIDPALVTAGVVGLAAILLLGGKKR